jgi:hypothetical protein
MLVAVVHHLRGAVRVGGPQMMVIDLGTVHVLPALVQDAAVGQRPRRVVVFHVGGQLAEDFLPSASQRCRTATWVSQHWTQRWQRLETNTIPPSGRYAGSMSSYGPSVNCRSRCRPRRSRTDGSAPSRRAGTRTGSSRRRNARPDRARRRGGRRAVGDLARPHVQAAQPPAVAKRPPLVVVGEVAEVRVPMPVLARLADGEHDLLDAVLGPAAPDASRAARSRSRPQLDPRGGGCSANAAAASPSGNSTSQIEYKPPRPRLLARDPQITAAAGQPRDPLGAALAVRLAVDRLPCLAIGRDLDLVGLGRGSLPMDHQLADRYVAAEIDFEPSRPVTRLGAGPASLPIAVESQFGRVLRRMHRRSRD